FNSSSCIGNAFNGSTSAKWPARSKRYARSKRNARSERYAIWDASNAICAI
ncbi:hypothetical protein TNIN_105191, partial [Trichonephila inaurata madagascariensis]